MLEPLDAATPGAELLSAQRNPGQAVDSHHIARCLPFSQRRGSIIYTTGTLMPELHTTSRDRVGPARFRVCETRRRDRNAW